MRAVRISSLIALAAWVLVGVILASPAAARVSTYTGQFLCDDRGTVTPLDGMNVELWERGSPDFMPVEIVGHRVDRGFTDSEGRFSLRTEDNNDKYFVRMALRDAHGVHLRDFWGINDWSVDTGERRNDVAVRNYGPMTFSKSGKSHKCAIWAGVHGANERYRAEIGADPPSHGVEIQADAVTAGVPFTPGTSILWPGDFSVGYGGGGDDSTTRHEYGHVIRHGFDGDFGHFLGDVVTYNYLQNHAACNHTNNGFAFNEGWAEFWAEDFSPAPDCGRPGDMETEGNVAAALTELMANCAGGQRKLMVETLQRNPGTIHSFAQFQAALGCPVPRLFPVGLIAASSQPEVAKPALPADRAKLVRQEVGAVSKYIRKINKSAQAAIRKAQNPPVCLREPCAKALKTLARPAILKFEIRLAKVQRRGAAALDSVKEQNKLAGLSVAQLVKRTNKQETANRKRLARAALAGVRDILKAARPVFKADDSKFAKKARRALSKAAARFRKATKKRSKTLPLSLTLQSMKSIDRPRRRPRIPTPIPVPTPSPGTFLTLTSLGFTVCPTQVVEPKEIEVAGTLSVAPAGSPVEVTFSSAGHGLVRMIVKTEAAGKWGTKFTPEQGQVGIWSVDASYAGGPTYAGSRAPTCQVSYVHP